MEQDLIEKRRKKLNEYLNVNFYFRKFKNKFFLNYYILEINQNPTNIQK